jgi:hypothetical protein
MIRSAHWIASAMALTVAGIRAPCLTVVLSQLSSREDAGGDQQHSLPLAAKLASAKRILVEKF